MTGSIASRAQNGGGTKPVSVTYIRLESVTSWLREITTPAVAESAVDKSIELAVLSPTEGRSGHIDLENLSHLSGLFNAAGLDAKQIIVLNDTVDFNEHHIENSFTSLEEPTTDQNLQAYSIADNVFGKFWTWDPVSRSLRGFLWYLNEEGQEQAAFILAGLSGSWFGVSYSSIHGLLPALLVLQVETRMMRVWIDHQAEEIMALQLTTGHHYYADTHFYAEERGTSYREGGSNSPSIQTLDLGMMSKKVCGLAINITTSALCLQRIVRLADFILEEATDSTNFEQPKLSSSSEVQRYSDSACSLVPRTRSAKRQAEGLLAEAEAWKHKATIMVQTLLSLTTQRDQNVSIGIAEDSRILARKATRDSKSMKGIAAVTMCFLPGTFVSSLLAMPMFDWDGDPGRSFNQNFWIYWAVTLPLTACVIALWLAWTNEDFIRIITTWKRRRLV